MLRKIITSAASSITIQLPEDMVGKTVEVLAFEIKDSDQTESKADRIKSIEKITANSLVDLANFKFNRNEANNY